MIVIMRSTLDYLKFNQIWPSDALRYGTNPKWRFWYYLRYILMTLSSLIPVVGGILHVCYYSILHGSTETLADDLIMITAEVGVYYFVMAFVPYQDKLEQLLMEFCDEREFGTPENYKKNTERLELVCRVYKCSIDLVILAYFVEPFFKNSQCEAENEFREYKEICGMVASIWLPVDLKQSPRRQLLYIWQTYSLLMTLKGAALTSFFVMETMEHLVLRIRHFKSVVRDAINTEDASTRVKRWQHCIMYHRAIFKWGVVLDSCYRFCLFVHVIVTGILFGIIGYTILNGISVKTLSLFAGWFLATFIVSASGQHLYDESLSVVDAIYDSKWYDKEVKFQKDIYFMLMRAQKAVKIHAGPFAELSHVFILMILKTGYSYTTLLSASSK